MDKQELLAYRKRLLAAGLPPRKVARHLREVQDHYQDLNGQALADGVDTATAHKRSRVQMGSLDELATAMIAGTPRSLLHRHPMLMTMLLPLILYCLVSISLVFALVSMFDAVTDQADVPLAELPLWLASVADGFMFVQSHVLTPLLAIVLIELAIRQHLLLRYWAPGVLLLCLLGSLSNMGFTLPDPASGSEGSLYMSFGRTRRTAVVLSEYANVLRLLVNLLLCGGWAWFSHTRQARIPSAHFDRVISAEDFVAVM